MVVSALRHRSTVAINRSKMYTHTLVVDCDPYGDATVNYNGDWSGCVEICHGGIRRSVDGHRLLRGVISPEIAFPWAVLAQVIARCVEIYMRQLFESLLWEARLP